MDGSGEADRSDQWVLDEAFVGEALVAEPSARARQNRHRFEELERAARQASRELDRRRKRRRRVRVAIGVAALAGFAAAVALVDPSPLPLDRGSSATGLFDGGAPESGPVEAVGHPTPAAAASTHPLGRPPDLRGDTGPYHFIATQANGRPVAYDPCRPIRYVVNHKHAPRGGDQIVDAAVDEIERATGLRFHMVGFVTEKPTSRRAAFLPGRYGNTWAPVLIAWTTPATIEYLAGDVAGVGGSNPYRPSATGDRVYVSGQIALDAPQVGAILRRPGGRAMAKAVVVHELGHLVGLDHVDDHTQLMYRRSMPGIDRPQAGDRAGLARLGRGRCFEKL